MGTTQGLSNGPSQAAFAMRRTLLGHSAYVGAWPFVILHVPVRAGNGDIACARRRAPGARQFRANPVSERLIPRPSISLGSSRWTPAAVRCLRYGATRPCHGSAGGGHSRPSIVRHYPTRGADGPMTVLYLRRFALRTGSLALGSAVRL
jgi:hypothetical protein